MKILFMLQSFGLLAFGRHGSEGASSNPVLAAVAGVLLTGLAFFALAGLLFPLRVPAMRWGKRGRSYPASKLSQLWWTAMFILGSISCFAHVLRWQAWVDGLWPWLVGGFILGFPLAALDTCKKPVKEKKE